MGKQRKKGEPERVNMVKSERKISSLYSDLGPGSHNTEPRSNMPPGWC